MQPALIKANDGSWNSRIEITERRFQMDKISQKEIPEELGGTVAEPPGTPGKAKLPDPEDLLKQVPKELRGAWVTYMTKGFENNQVMFQRTLDAFMRPYTIMVGMYVIIFVIGVLFFGAAAYLGLTGKEPALAAVFGGLSVVSFLMFFIRQPIQAITINLEFISWLGVAFNTYWTRLMYISHQETVQAELKAAADDYCAMVERIIDKHTLMHGKLPGGKLEPTFLPKKPAGKEEDQPAKRQEASPADIEETNLAVPGISAAKP
jgi:hypothetical protein